MKLSRYFLISLILLISCGGGGGSDDKETNNSADKTNILGRWKGTVTEVTNESCSVPDGINPTGKELTYDISFWPSADLVAVETDETSYKNKIYSSGDQYGSTDNYLFDSYDNVYEGNPNSPTKVLIKNLGNEEAEFILFVFYNRFCTSKFKGIFKRIDNSEDLVPQYQDVVGDWRGSLKVVTDECDIGVQDLNEFHSITSSGSTVSLVSTDRRILTGHWKTTSSFYTEIYTNNNSDIIHYSNISNKKATVEIQHYGLGCLTSWEGVMTKN